MAAKKSKRSARSRAPSKTKSKSKAKASSTGKKVRLRAFVKPIGHYNDAVDHPGIVVPDFLLDLAAAAGKATVDISGTEPLAEQWHKLKVCLEALYAEVAPANPPKLVLLSSPSCWNAQTKSWEPGACVAANAVVHERNYALLKSPGACWELIISLQVEER